MFSILKRWRSRLSMEQTRFKSRNIIATLLQIMKSLHIFRIYVNYEEETRRENLGIWKAKGQHNPKVTLELYICKVLTWEQGRNFCSHAFSWSVNEGWLFSSFALVLLVVGCGSVYCWFDFILLIAICRLFSYALVNMDHVECNMCCKLFPLHAKLNMTVKLILRCFWFQNNWLFCNLELFHFSWESIVNELLVNDSSNYSWSEWVAYGYDWI